MKKKPGQVQIATRDQRSIRHDAHQVRAEEGWLRVYLDGDEVAGVPTGNVADWRWLRRPA